MTDENEGADFEAHEAEIAEVDVPEVSDADTPDASQAPDPQPKWAPEDEDEARLFGWKSADEWKGERPPGYIDNPAEYMDRVRRSRIFQTMEEKLSKASEAARKMEAMNEAALRRQRQEYEGRLSALTQAQRKAVEIADVDEWDRLERERQALVQSAPEPEQPKSNEPPPEVVEYYNSQEWAKNPILWEEAKQAVDIGMQRGLVGATPREQLQFAENAIRAKYPHLFAAKPVERAVRPSPVDAGGIAGGGASQSAFTKLPPEAKAQFQRFVKEGLYKDDEASRKEFADDYHAA